MLYLLTSPRDPAVADLLDRRRVGLMAQPRSNPPRAGWLWAADNGCFARSWEPEAWRTWLARQPRAGCLFAVVPDVVGDHAATLARFAEYAPEVRELGYPVAFAAQDGATVDSVPWAELDALFVGGSLDWKWSEAPRLLAAYARDRTPGRWVHVGRINSARRYRAWSEADSCDGSFVSYAPTGNAARLARWLDDHERNPQLT